MVNQENYEKVLQFYNGLKNQYADVESARVEMYQHVSGKKMWSEIDRLHLESHRRPALQYNLELPVLLYLTGTQLQSRTYKRAIPNDDKTTEQAAQQMTKLMYWNFNRTKYEYQNSLAFGHSLIAGLGWKHRWFDHQEGHYVCKAFDGMRIRFDTRTQSSTLEDCRYLQDTQWSTKEDIFALIDDDATLRLVKDEFRFLEPSPKSTSFLDKQNTNWTWNYTPRQDQWDYIDTIEGRYRLVDHHEMRDVCEYVLVDTRNKDNFEIVTEMPIEQIQAMLATNPYFVRLEINRKEFWHTIICPAIQKVIVDEPYPIQTGQFAFMPTVCYDIVPELRETTSVFDNLKDINDSINKRKSTMLEYIMQTVGGNWMAESGSMVKKEDWENNERGVVLEYNKNFKKPERDVPAPLPAGLVEYEREDKEMMQQISSVTPNLRGFRESANETGVLARYKIQQAEIVFSKLFANSNLSEELDALDCIKQIQGGMTLPRKIRVLSPNGDPEWLALNWETLNGKLNDITLGQYDIEIDSSKPSITAQQLAFFELSDLMKTMPPDLTLLLLDKYITASEIPDKMVIVKRIKQVMKRNFGFDPDNPDQIYAQPQAPQGAPPAAMAASQEMQRQTTNPLEASLIRAGV